MRVSLAAFAALVLFTSPMPARAGGFEFATPGTRSLGRGGATLARADDPLVLGNNPANLADLYGTQLTLQTHVAFNHACFDREGTYGMNYRGGAPAEDSIFGNVNDFLNTEYPEVCDSGPPGIVPELAFGWRINEHVGVGVGLIAPAAIGHSIYGRRRDGSVRVPGSPTGRLPSPLRYGLIEQQLLIVFPTVGVGVRLHPRFRMGVAFGSGFGVFDYLSYVRATGGEDFPNDVRSTLHASDPFIPRVDVSLHAVPHDNLDIMLGFRWIQQVEADGRVELVSAAYRGPQGGEATPFEARVAGNCRRQYPNDMTRCDRGPIRNSTLIAPQPMQVAFGIRYSDRIAPRPRDANEVGDMVDRIEDPMSTERWDIELDVVYEINSLVDDFVIYPGREDSDGDGQRDDNPLLIVDPALSMDGLAIPRYECVDAQGVRVSGFSETDGQRTCADPSHRVVPANISPHRWRDQIAIRLGGDYNLIPGMIAVRGGLSFETHGVGGNYETLDFTPYMRIGVHAGVTLRIGKLDVSLGYAFIQNLEQRVRSASQEACRAEVPGRREVDCGYPQLVSSPLAPGGTPTVINAGRFRSRVNAVSLGLNYNFR